MVEIGGKHYEFIGVLMTIIPLLTLLFYGLVIYFLVSVILFMRKKTRNDEQMLHKLNELLELKRRETDK